MARTGRDGDDRAATPRWARVASGEVEQLPLIAVPFAATLVWQLERPR